MSEAFWAFSLRFYQLPGVAESCIALQDRHGADVNLLLFALWTAASGHRIDAEMIAAVDRAARQWRETVTQPLRAARRALKTTPGRFDEPEVTALRRQVMAAELEAERLQQDAMARDLTFDARDACVAAARGNLGRYAALLGAPVESGPIARLLQAFVASSDRPGCDGDSASANTLQAPP